MTHTEFVNGLSKVPFKREVYKKQGLDDEFIVSNEARYNLVKKKEIENGEGDDPILTLINQYEVSKLEIGMVRFDQKESSRQGNILFGKVEVDDLGISNITKEILVFEEDTTHVLWYCAANSQAFLTALLQIAHFMERQSVDEDLFENEDMQRWVAEQCADAAGGAKYINFYRMLLGV